jgi:hypothetical protein
MGEESDRVEVPADAPFFARALDMETGLRHILAPAFFGALVGGLWQWKVMPQIGEINLPNPVHGAFWSVWSCRPYFTGYSWMMKHPDGENTPLDWLPSVCFSQSFGSQVGGRCFVVGMEHYWFGFG